MREIWKSIPGWEGLYVVSNLARVKHLPYTRGKGKYDANCFEIEPIPLTVEVLTCNGWKWSDEHEEFAKHGVAIYPVGNDYRTDIFNMKIRYVHELQHLLFGLGLDNFMKMPKNYILPKGGEI